MVDRVLMSDGQPWQREWLFHVSRDCQASIWFHRTPTRREVENLLKFVQLSLDQGVYDDQPPGPSPEPETETEMH